jgi:hypothetical protein
VRTTPLGEKFSLFNASFFMLGPQDLWHYTVVHPIGFWFNYILEKIRPFQF